VSETEQEQPEVQPREDEEAEEAEQEEAQPEAEPSPPVIHPPPETESVEPQSLTQEQWEDRFKKAEKAFDAYARKIGVIFEEDANALNPISISPSAPPGFLNINDAGRVPDEIKVPILTFFGIQQEADYELDPDQPSCSKCKGKGKVRTGSAVPNYRTLPCPRCKGSGLEPQAGGMQNGPAEPVPVLVQTRNRRSRRT
jgi:hypothetical protein